MTSAKFGTSGLRGLAIDLTDERVSDYVHAFLRAVPSQGPVYVGRDLRASSPGISGAVIRAVLTMGRDVVDCGALPTPALALEALADHSAAIMVTGSHIPADRNGLKFYGPGGEIDKTDEARILANLKAVPAHAAQQGTCVVANGAIDRFCDRITMAMGSEALAGLRVGVWDQSSVARDVLHRVLQGCGAETVSFDRRDAFVPIDTEAVGQAALAMLGEAIDANGLDAMVSTDGDGDRPLMVLAGGRQVPGDLLGLFTARYFNAETVCVPVSANTALERSELFQVQRTRIGSPYVLAAMAGKTGRVVGFEPNGGFILGFDAEAELGTIPPLLTRDCLLPLVVPLALAKSTGVTMDGLLGALPPRFTAADRLQDIAPEVSQAVIDAVRQSSGLILDDGIDEVGRDETDGLRLTLGDDTIVMLRASGNAPEMRVYAEASSMAAANRIVSRVMARIGDDLMPRLTTV